MFYCDCGSNLVGADNELKEIISNLDKEKIDKFALSRGFQFHFHPPQASEHGGHYERHIRSIRQVLRGVSNQQKYHEDHLTTFMCEVEKILNSRPLTPVSNDPDSVPLTPNLILLLRGNPSVSIVDDPDESWPRLCYKRASYLADVFWKRYLREYVPLLQIRQKNLVPQRNLVEGDIVLMTGEGYAQGFWPLARVI